MDFLTILMPMPVLPVTPGIGMMAGSGYPIIRMMPNTPVLQLGGKRFRNVDYGVFALR